MECQRCSDCQDNQHHWITNPAIGDDEHPELQEADFVCKHCGAYGKECSACFGDGLEPLFPENFCDTCDGDGVRSWRPPSALTDNQQITELE